MKMMLRTLVCMFAIGFVHAEEPEIGVSEKKLPLTSEPFLFNGRHAFVISPAGAKENVPWVWYAPTLDGLPGGEELAMVGRLLAEGIAIAGIDVGESYGNPEGRKVFTDFHAYLVEKRKFRKQAVLLARSRGGLMLYNWAVENPQLVAGVAGIYPVCNLASYPGIEKAAPAYGMSTEEFQAKLANHNPLDRLKTLADSGVPIFHIHGDSDKIVPLEDNSGELGKRYRELGGSFRLELIKDGDHDLNPVWFRSEKLIEFMISKATGKAPVGQVTMMGVLQGGMVAIGGETSGWQLTYMENGKKKQIEVDMSAIDLSDVFDGKEVSVTGRITDKAYVERKNTKILVADEVILDQ